ncbi:Mor transcription activator domain protein [Nitrosomonas sp. Is79A3]|uniref:Mor transcription activator family protein n=1 Tax=Nitrosomonas sp. (strain Is79A3) TaxID=261292 RepID=UPI000215CFF5
MTHEIDQSLLPGILLEISELIGIKATLKLVAKYGGVRLYVPKTLRPDHDLVEIIGRESAEYMTDRFGGEVLEIPKATLANTALRNISIRQEYSFLSQRQLALKYQTTERHIRRILSGCDQNDNQMDLF